MKKLLYGYVAGSLTVLMFVNVFNICGFGKLSDEELMNEYINENHGEQYYGVLHETENDEYVTFAVYRNGCKCYDTAIEKEYYQNHYE